MPLANPYFPGLTKAWTADEVLPGGDLDSLSNAILALTRKHPSLPIDYLGRLVSRHGARAERLLKGVRAMADLGEMFGAGATMLSEREIDFCIREEWARKPDDILWRRTKCGLHMDAAERARAATFIETRVAALNKLT